MQKIDSKDEYGVYKAFRQHYGVSLTRAGYEMRMLHLKAQTYTLELVKQELNKNYIDAAMRTVRSKKLRTFYTSLIGADINEDAALYFNEFRNLNKYYRRKGMPNVRTIYNFYTIHDYINKLIPYVNVRCYEAFINLLADTLQ